ncbi:ubiquinone biosynthesis monooxygenase COQ6, mitochondrial [Daktulosphaira vitifoliae]|uniref:ubiquinone biosynthesis monooxygenase COQ6, mitochondrial n=1 Tax=Daktulosphaira vitifoliae TaxID=58002 RepID=UPI0021AAFC56|nr:ubiquinone biosynthesis monooxygenase COQ6, mitochondrial [Daktulosphaira vitifoliae]XP_050539760.1 ubiquinone biosynthesis monooxygenase COQ6, mitochondrial [Daktulosphaira vitifoliae]XP_050539761.1 ubiquinone biosynthesis monooxygenase COQ6, mitochondrial [Daktulosphaira vitifoliae]XP_050539763.1 ubiquinone biosynthesis monooxygenase COQ6, mitochondrial [Daktulosphaira vitifoliae]
MSFKFSTSPMFKKIIFMLPVRPSKNVLMSVISSKFHLFSKNYMNDSFKNCYDIIIAGGGMVGCAMACKLANEPALKGFSILLLEGGPFKEYKINTEENRVYSNRVSALSESSVKLLKSVGAWQFIESVNGFHEVKEMKIWSSGKQKKDINNVLHFKNEKNLAYIVENNFILGALYRKINEEPNITVKYNSIANKCVLTKQGECVTVKIADDNQLYETSLLIGSDGFGSKVRKAISGQHYLSWDYGQRAVVATVQIKNTQQSNANVAWQKFVLQGPVALLPLNNETYSLVWTTSIEEAEHLVQSSDDEFISALNTILSEEELNNYNSVIVDDLNKIMSKLMNKFLLTNDECQNNNFSIPLILGVAKNSRASFPLGFGHACRYVGQRIAIIGDAAHRVHPLAGQGVNLGFNDVSELSNQLNKSLLVGAEIGDENALLQYESNAQAQNIPIMIGIDGIQKIYGSHNSLIPNSILTFGRNLGLTFCQSASLLKKILTRKASGLPT